MTSNQGTVKRVSQIGQIEFLNKLKLELRTRGFGCLASFLFLAEAYLGCPFVLQHVFGMITLEKKREFARIRGKMFH